MKSKLKIIIPLVLVIMGATYKLVLAKPAPAPKPRIDGEVYVLPKEFLINLSDGHFAKLAIALVLQHGQSASGAGGAHGVAVKPPDGFGTLPQEAVVRDIVTDVVTDSTTNDLVNRNGRLALKAKILSRIDKASDVKVHDVLFTDVAVQ
jgi:flagellar basal body-associated protein FliL